MKYCRIPIQNLLSRLVNWEYLGDCSGKFANVVLFLEHFEKASNHVLSSNFSCKFPSSSTDIFTNVHRMNRLSIWETNTIRIYDATNVKDDVFMISLLMHAWKFLPWQMYLNFSLQLSLYGTLFRRMHSSTCLPPNCFFSSE